MHSETALVMTEFLGRSHNKVIRWGFGSSVIARSCVLAVVFFAGLNLCFLSEDSMVNAVLSTN